MTLSTMLAMVVASGADADEHSADEPSAVAAAAMAFRTCPSTAPCRFCAAGPDWLAAISAAASLRSTAAAMAEASALLAVSVSLAEVSTDDKGMVAGMVVAASRRKRGTFRLPAKRPLPLDSWRLVRLPSVWRRTHVAPLRLKATDPPPPDLCAMESSSHPALRRASANARLRPVPHRSAAALPTPWFPVRVLEAQHLRIAIRRGSTAGGSILRRDSGDSLRLAGTALPPESSRSYCSERRRRCWPDR